MAMTAAERQAFRSEIRKTALPFFLDRAIADVSLQSIADAMGVSFWSVYRQYETRELLYRAALEPALAELATAAAACPYVTTSVRAAVAASIRHASDLMQRDLYRQLLFILVRDGGSQDWLTAFYSEQIIEPLCRCIERAIRRAGDEQGFVIGIEPGASRRALRMLESRIVMPRLLPHEELTGQEDSLAAIRDAATTTLIAATYSVEFAEPAAA